MSRLQFSYSLRGKEAIRLMDLKQQGKYKVAPEESYCKAGPMDRADPDFPVYYQIIPGRSGEIYWHSDNRLAVQVNSGRLMGKVKRLKGVEAFIEGDGEGVYLFPLNMLDTIAEIIKARKRRQVTEKMREHLKKVGQKTRFKSLK